MTLYMKRFIYAALVYLALAAVFGILNGVTDMGYLGSFAHTHFNLLGFMSMMVFGIGYFILPRFNGTDLRFPNWVPVHFWLGNISLIGMVVFRGLNIESGNEIFHLLFIVSASIQVVSIFMFVVNVWISLSPPASKPQTSSLPSSSEGQPSMTVTADSGIANLIDICPSVKNVLIAEGLRALAIPDHIDRVRMSGVTLGMVAQNHGLDLNRLIEKVSLEMSEKNNPGEVINDITPQATTDQLIGTIINEYPQSKQVFSKYFGTGCFDCPGQAYESVDMACRMHGVDPEIFLQELNTVLKS